jgi:hypothetical protein
MKISSLGLKKEQEWITTVEWRDSRTYQLISSESIAKCDLSYDFRDLGPTKGKGTIVYRNSADLGAIDDPSTLLYYWLTINNEKSDVILRRYTDSRFGPLSKKPIYQKSYIEDVVVLSVSRHEDIELNSFFEVGIIFKSMEVVGVS